MGDNFLLPFEVESNETWNKGGEYDQLMLTVPSDSDFEEGDELVMMRKAKFKTLISDIDLSKVDIE